LNNRTWNDVALELQLNQDWGLPGGAGWDLYRWYPDPARLRGDGATFAKTVPFSLRPFEVVLLETVPAGTPPSLGRNFPAAPLPRTFDASSRELPLVTSRTQQEVTVRGEVPPCQRGSTLVISTEMLKGSIAVMTRDVGKHFAASGTLGGRPAECHAVLGIATPPASWQAWRIAVEASAAPQTFQFSITNSIEEWLMEGRRLAPAETEVTFSCRAHILSSLPA
jgi:hypothetical protein